MDLNEYKDGQLIRACDLAKCLSVSRRHIDRLAASEGFPMKIKLGERSTAFRAGDIRRWIESGGWRQADDRH